MNSNCYVLKVNFKQIIKLLVGNALSDVTLLLGAVF